MRGAALLPQSNPGTSEDVVVVGETKERKEEGRGREREREGIYFIAVAHTHTHTHTLFGCEDSLRSDQHFQ